MRHQVAAMAETLPGLFRARAGHRAEPELQEHGNKGAERHRSLVEAASVLCKLGAEFTSGGLSHHRHK